VVLQAALALRPSQFQAAYLHPKLWNYLLFLTVNIYILNIVRTGEKLTLLRATDGFVCPTARIGSKY